MVDLKSMTDDELIKLAYECKQDYEAADLEQYVLKILQNSSYGSLSLVVNSFSHGKGFSAAITTGGRMANKWCNYIISKGIDKLLGTNTEDYNYTVVSDTDSGYIRISDIMKKKIDSTKKEWSLNERLELVNTISQKLLYPMIYKAIDEVAYALNCYDKSFIDMEQETIADRFVATGNKRYFCRYYKNGKPKHKITGLSLISKSTPPYFKEKLTPVLDIVLDEDSMVLMDYIDEIYKEFKTQSVELISPIKGVSSLDYQWNQGKLQTVRNGKTLPAPINSRAAILHNEYVEKMGLNYEPIRNGDKVYLTNLITPNPIKNQDIIGYTNPKFLKDSGLLKYVDYDTLFYKNFKKNIELITEPINWSLDKFQASMDEWS